MNRWLFIFLILAASIAYAESDKLYVLSLKYENESISLADKTVKYGFYPDRKIQPEDGYTCEVVGNDGAILYSFKFEVPLKEFTDVSKEDELKGGLIVYDKQNFALAMPYFDDAKEIRFSSEGKDLLKVDVEEKLGYRWLKIAIWVPIILAAFIYYIVWSVKKKK